MKGIQFDKHIGVGTIFNFVTILILFVITFTWMQSDIEKVKSEQERMNEFRQEVRADYINRDQLHYIVIERLDRLERNLEGNFQRLEQKIDSSN